MSSIIFYMSSKTTWSFEFLQVLSAYLRPNKKKSWLASFKNFGRAGGFYFYFSYLFLFFYFLFFFFFLWKIKRSGWISPHFFISHALTSIKLLFFSIYSISYKVYLSVDMKKTSKKFMSVIWSFDIKQPNQSFMRVLDPSWAMQHRTKGIAFKLFLQAKLQVIKQSVDWLSVVVLLHVHIVCAWVIWVTNALSVARVGVTSCKRMWHLFC